MKNLPIFLLFFFCLFQLNMTLFSQDDVLNTVFANTKQHTEKKIPVIDQNIPNIIETATFAMGWFWGPDSLFGAVPGVIHTRVGYAGGEKDSPTYYNLGKHSESLQIDYDPNKINYQELLKLFWDNHNYIVKSITRQYMSIIFYHNPEQLKIATQSAKELEDKSNIKVVTEIIPLTNFYLAENYHQKYRLQQSGALKEHFMEIYPKFDDFINSTAVARINGFMGGKGTCEQLKKEIDSYGLTELLKKILLGRVCNF